MTQPSSSAAPTSTPSQPSLLQRLRQWFHHFEPEERAWQKRQRLQQDGDGDADENVVVVVVDVDARALLRSRR